LNHPSVFFVGKPPKNPPPLIGEAEQNPASFNKGAFYEKSGASFEAPLLG